MEPGRKINIRLELDQIAYCLPRGHKLRLAISNSYWPFIWPSPEVTEITVYRGNLSLPYIDDKRKLDENSFDYPVVGESNKYRVKRPPSSTRKSFFDKKTEQNVLEVKHDSGCEVDLEHGLETDSAVVERFFLKEGQPLSAQIDVNWYQILKRGKWNVYIESKINVLCDRDYFYLKGSVNSWENSKLAFSREFDESIPRDFV